MIESLHLRSERLARLKTHDRREVIGVFDSDFPDEVLGDAQFGSRKGAKLLHGRRRFDDTKPHLVGPPEHALVVRTVGVGKPKHVTNYGHREQLGS